MNKGLWTIGYAESVETAPGVWEDNISEHEHFGELVRNTSKFVTSQNLNDNVSTSTEVSIIADTYAFEHFYDMRYIEMHGVKWKIEAVQPKYPRLILTIGGLYNA